MPGIYLHIPFCKQACHYCNFHFTTSLKHKDELVNALINEIQLRKQIDAKEIVNTIYFGGGTPSLLTIDECKLIIDAIHENFNVSADVELTLEANPDDITTEKLNGWKAAGVNRLSIGVQSFFEEELLWMNRAHNAAHAKNCIEQSLDAGFTNMTIDLIYGSPLLTDDMWEKNVKTAIEFGIPHLSCYALTVEEKTPLHKQINLQQKQTVDGDKQAHQFLLLMQWMRSAGYEHYEVSNFAKPGFRSRHNSSYWKGVNYIGIGPSAHSYNGVTRQWNVANNQKYISSIKAGILPAEEEILTEQNRLNEYIMISLRTVEGIDLNVIEKTWGIENKELITQQLQTAINRNQVYKENNFIKLTDEGMLAADGIASGLFIV